jgi:predicted nucleic-acid-binding protein
MTGLDTNVLIRYLTQDDAAQASKASRIVERADAGGLFVSAVVLCEIVWVLDTSYGYAREQIAQAIERILMTAQFSFQEKGLLWLALTDYQRGKGDFADHVIGRTARAAGTEYTLTFDRALKGSDMFRVL